MDQHSGGPSIRLDQHAESGPGHVRSRVAQVSLLLLAAAALYQGVWAQLAPHPFYLRFPAGMGWVASEGPYNEHLARDGGGMVNGMAAVTLVAAWTRSKPLIAATTLGWLVYGLPHFGYHVVHPLDDVSMQILNVVVLTGEIVLPLLGLLAVLGPAEPQSTALSPDTRPRVKGGMR